MTSSSEGEKIRERLIQKETLPNLADSTETLRYEVHKWELWADAEKAKQVNDEDYERFEFYERTAEEIQKYLLQAIGLLQGLEEDIKGKRP